MKKLLSIIFGLILALNLWLPFAFAQAIPPIIPPQTSDTQTTIYLPHTDSKADPASYVQSDLLPKVTNIVIAVTGGLSLLFVVISGIQILIAFGNEEKITVAKKTLTWALGGLVIAILSYAIVQIIVSIKVDHPTQTQTNNSGKP